MKDFSNAVNEAMGEMISDGTVENIIKKKLGKTVEDIIEDQLRSYSDFGKALKDKIHDELKVDLKDVTFTEYNKTILNLIEGILNNAVTGEAKKKFTEDLEELFKAPPTEIKLSEVIKMYIEEQDEEFDRDGAERIALIMENKRDKWIGIGLNPKNTKSSYGRGAGEEITSWHDCNLYISVLLDDENSGKLRFAYDRDGLQPLKYMPTCLSGTARLLYQLYCAGSKIVFDEGFDPDNYDIYYPEIY
jgi:hypothetical protein